MISHLLKTGSEVFCLGWQCRHRQTTSHAHWDRPIPVFPVGKAALWSRAFQAKAPSRFATITLPHEVPYSLQLIFKGRVDLFLIIHYIKPDRWVQWCFSPGAQWSLEAPKFTNNYYIQLTITFFLEGSIYFFYFIYIFKIIFFRLKYFFSYN